jgi:hypothetical protein
MPRLILFEWRDAQWDVLWIEQALLGVRLPNPPFAALVVPRTLLVA